MRVSVYYINGAVDEFNLETFTALEPFSSSAGGVNICTELCLRTDLLAKEGLRLDIYWYNNINDINTHTVYIPEAGRDIPVAGRELGRVLYLVSKEELGLISKVLVDGGLVVWRQGHDLINAVAFASQEMLCYSDSNTKSINAKATEIFDYLKTANPELSDAQITQLFGYPYEAYQRILENEGAQLARKYDGLAGDVKVVGSEEIKKKKDRADDATPTMNCSNMQETDEEVGEVVTQDDECASKDVIDDISGGLGVLQGVIDLSINKN